ncbi:putative TfdA family oxidoreductase [Cladochytrium replicatum]|nr:putative TfdA family oxidoreductase [Cladochytrium replicatum]
MTVAVDQIQQQDAAPLKAAVSKNLTANEILEEYPLDPTISYSPNRSEWIERQIKNAPKAKGVSLPEGFPEKIESTSVWDAFELQNQPERWIYQLSTEDNEALGAALKSFKDSKLPLPELSRATFPLPESFVKRIDSWADQILNGVGFFQLRGFNIDDYTKEDAILIYTGLASYIGEKRLNQGRGIFAHIKALPKDAPKEAIFAPAHEDVVQVFHTDAIPGGNIASFLVINAAEKGGESQVASIGRVYNDIAKYRPDVVRTLASNWLLDNSNYPHGKAGDFADRPLLYYENNRIVAAIARRSVTGYGIWGRHKSLPRATEEQKEALDTLHFLGEKHGLTIPIRRGDIQFLNNYEVFHARQGYEDSEENTRHLVRLWLKSERIEWKNSEHLNGKKERYESNGTEKWNFEDASL